MNDIRVQEYGVASYWPSSMAGALGAAQAIMARNGCGNIQVRGADGLWRIAYRFERWAGIVAEQRHT